MPKQSQFSIIIPCYNEIENIQILLDNITPLTKKYPVEFILVENGSTDDSKEYFTKKVENKFSSIKVVYVNQNRGYGYGIQKGYEAVSGKYVGWLHADLQVPPQNLIPFFETIQTQGDDQKLFLKGLRQNRNPFDLLFTYGQSVFNSLLFQQKLYDIGATPVLFNHSLIEEPETLPNDFSIELYVYHMAVTKQFSIIRLPITVEQRHYGQSSWNHNWKSKIHQSKIILNDSLKIKKGEKVL